MSASFFKQSGHWPVLIVVFVCSFFINNQVIYTDIMECRNVITAREMVYDGNWLVPTMNGDLRLEKPPFPTWMAAAVEYAVPDSIVAQRTMAGVFAALLCCFFYLFAFRLTRNRTYALVSTLVLCTSYNIILMGRTASWDIYCHAFMMGAVYFLFTALQQKERYVRNFLAAGLCMGMSFLSKGPVSFYALLLPFLVSYGIVYRGGMKGKWRAVVWMLAILLVISTWWYAYIYISHPEMASFVFNKEASSWTNHNVRPWYYYWAFFLETGIWSLLTLTTLAYPYWKKRVQAPKAYQLSFLWMLAIIFFLSLIPEKKTRYLLPVLLPASLAMGHLFTYWIAGAAKHLLSRTDKLVYRLNAYAVTLAVSVIPVFAYWFVYRNGFMDTGMFVVICIFVGSIAAGLFWSSFRVKPFILLAGVVALFMVAEVLMMPYVGTVVNNNESKSIRATYDNEALKPLPFYYDKNGMLRIEIVYEARKKIRPLDLTDEQAVMKALPFVLVSQQPAEEMFSAALAAKLDMRWIDTYDNNRRQKNTKRYSPVFIHNVTVITKKEEPGDF